MTSMFRARDLRRRPQPVGSSSISERTTLAPDLAIRGRFDSCSTGCSTGWIIRDLEPRMPTESIDNVRPPWIVVVAARSHSLVGPTSQVVAHRVHVTVSGYPSARSSTKTAPRPRNVASRSSSRLAQLHRTCRCSAWTRSSRRGRFPPQGKCIVGAYNARMGGSSIPVTSSLDQVVAHGQPLGAVIARYRQLASDTKARPFDW